MEHNQPPAFTYSVRVRTLEDLKLEFVRFLELEATFYRRKSANAKLQRETITFAHTSRILLDAASLWSAAQIIVPEE